MAGQLGNLVVRITTDLKGLNKGLGDARSSVARSTGEITRLTSQAGRSLTRFGLVVGAGLTAAVTASAKFENSFANVRKTIDATEKEFAQLEKNIRSLATTIPVGTTELNNIATIAGQLGVRGVDNITKFTTTIAKLGVAADSLSAEEAAKSLARIINITGEGIETIDKLASVVVDLGNKLNATEQEILFTGQGLATISKIAGITATDVLGISSALAATGAQAQASRTAISKVFIGINDAIREGGKELRIFADTADLTIDEFQELARTDPAQIFAKFTEGLKAAGKEATIILEDLELADQRVLRVLLGLANAEGTVAEALEIARKAYEENIALQEEAERKFATTTARLRIFINKIVDLAIEIGDTLKPAFDELLEDFDGLLKNIKKYVSANPEATAEFAKLAVKITVVSLALGQLLKILALLPNAIGAITAALQFLFATPAGFVIFSIATALIGLIFAIKKFNNTYPEFSKFLMELAEIKFVKFLQGIKDVIVAITELQLKLIGFQNTPLTRLNEQIRAMGDPRTAGIQGQEARAIATGQALPFTTPISAFPAAPTPLGGAEPEGPGAPAGEDDTTSFLDTFKEKLTEAKDAFTQFNTELQEEWASTGTSFVEVATQFTEVLTSAFGTAIADIVLGVTSAEEAFKQLANTAIRFLIEFAAKELANFVLRKALAAASAAFQLATASSLASALGAIWAPVAALVSLATAGGNAAPASAGITAVAALAQGVAKIPGFAEGGVVDRPTLAMVGEGGEREFIIPESKMGSMGTKVVMNNTFNVSSELDLDIITEKLGRDLERRDNEV